MAGEAEFAEQRRAEPERPRRPQHHQPRPSRLRKSKQHQPRRRAHKPELPQSAQTGKSTRASCKEGPVATVRDAGEAAGDAEVPEAAPAAPADANATEEDEPRRQAQEQQLDRQARFH